MSLRSDPGSTAPPPFRLLEAVALEVAQPNPSADLLGEHVRVYALEAYARRVPPERMIVFLKHIVAEAMSEMAVRSRVELLSVLIPYAVEGYYLDPWIRSTGAVRRHRIALRRDAGEAESAN